MALFETARAICVATWSSLLVIVLASVPYEVAGTASVREIADSFPIFVYKTFFKCDSRQYHTDIYIWECALNSARCYYTIGLGLADLSERVADALQLHFSKRSFKWAPGIFLSICLLSCFHFALLNRCLLCTVHPD